jgi:acetyltransferase-like isoleucine patch superfamily enzyme
LALARDASQDPGTLDRRSAGASGLFAGSAERPAQDREAAVTRSVFPRLLRALAEETRDLNPRLLLAGALVGLLPNLSFSRLRTAIYRHVGGIRIGPQSRILGRIEFTGTGPGMQDLVIGSNCIINAHLFVDLNAEIRIGDRVSIGHHVTLITADHEVGPACYRAGPVRPLPISIGDGSWIGAGTTMLPGVSFGRASVAAAGSLVSGRVPDNRMVGGVPARALKSLPLE